ncbi:unnamed protein product [Staurois parvus]|uniref:Uncharacterized protein n=1 Tax=Staurois parvus TaxID=386267 RepID=A0ABN9BDN0_9NEOB|nr:unnamed protein product [Staurois parvus]
MFTVLHDCAIVIQSVIALKAENWPGQEGGESVRTGRRGKCPDWKGGKVSGREGGESVRTGRGVKVSGLEGGESVRTGRG